MTNAIAFRVSRLPLKRLPQLEMCCPKNPTPHLFDMRKKKKTSSDSETLQCIWVVWPRIIKQPSLISSWYLQILMLKAFKPHWIFRSDYIYISTRVFNFPELVLTLGCTKELRTARPARLRHCQCWHSESLGTCSPRNAPGAQVDRFFHIISCKSIYPCMCVYIYIDR